MKPTKEAIKLAQMLTATALVGKMKVAQQFAEKCQDDHAGADVFWSLYHAINLVLGLADGILPERGKKALELFEHRAEYWEYLMERAGNMSRRDIAELIISRMSLADIAEDYEDIKQFREDN